MGWQDAPAAGQWASAPAVAPINDSSHSAGIVANAVASLAEDPNAQISYFAKQRGIPASRYRIVNGRAAYQADDGKWYYEQPNAALSQPSTWLPSLARGVGPAIPAVAGATAGMVTAPMLLTGPPGMAASMALTGGAAFGGEAARQALAKALVGQEPNVWPAVNEGASAALAQGIAAGLGVWAERSQARDLSRLNRGDVQVLRSKAQARNIPLTPAEETNLPSLKAQQKALGNLPASSDTMADFYKMRAEKVGQAVNKELQAISPVDSAEIAGLRGREAAQGAIKDARQAAQEAARPLYNEAFAANQSVMSPQISKILETPAGRKALSRAATMMQDDMSLLGVPDKELGDLAREAADLGKMEVPEGGVAKGLKLRTLDYVKQALWDMADETRPSSPRHARIIDGLRKSLTEELDNLDVTARAGPNSLKAEGGAYAQARSMYAGQIPLVKELENNITGIIADLPDTRLQQAAAKMFSPATSGPNAVGAARTAIEGQSPEAWQALKRAWLQQLWDKAGQEYATTGADVVNRGAKFRALVFGNQTQKAMLRQALTAQEWQSLSDLSDVLEAAGRVKAIGSDTAWNQEMMAEIRRQGTPVWAKAARLLRPQDWGRLIEDWGTERAIASHAGDLAEIITQPGAADRLKELKALSPASMRFRVGLAHLLVQGGRAGLDESSQ